MPWRKRIVLALLLTVVGAALTAQAQSLAPPPALPAPTEPSPALAPPPTAQPVQPSRPPAPPAPGPRPLDMVVTVTLATGKSETFAREIDRLEIITRAGGEIALVHLVLVTGGERNTHVWYNYDQVAKLSYRFVTPEGPSKLYVRVLQDAPPARELSDVVDPLSPREFR